jgi:hypothetical protein
MQLNSSEISNIESGPRHRTPSISSKTTFKAGYSFFATGYPFKDRKKPGLIENRALSLTSYS